MTVLPISLMKEMALTIVSSAIVSSAIISAAFLLEFRCVCKILTVSVQNHTWRVYILKSCAKYGRDLHSWCKFYTTTSRDGRDKYQLCVQIALDPSPPHGHCGAVFLNPIFYRFFYIAKIS